MWCCIHRLILSRQGRVIKAFTKSFLESAKITSEANEWPRCYLNLVLPWGPLWGSRAVHCKGGASEIKKKKKIGLPLYTSLSYRNLTYLPQT